MRPLLSRPARVLEIAAGSGEHALFFATRLPHVTWQPTDPSAEALASIAAWRERDGPPNLLGPMRLDATAPATWPAGPFDGVVCINMIHISPWAATDGLMRLAGGRLAPGGFLFLYGPYLEAEVETSPSNLAFDADLKRRNPAWGIRDLADVKAQAAANGFVFEARTAMPANNLCVVFRKA